MARYELAYARSLSWHGRSCCAPPSVLRNSRSGLDAQLGGHPRTEADSACPTSETPAGCSASHLGQGEPSMPVCVSDG